MDTHSSSVKTMVSSPFKSSWEKFLKNERKQEEDGKRRVSVGSLFRDYPRCVTIVSSFMPRNNSMGVGLFPHLFFIKETN